MSSNTTASNLLADVVEVVLGVRPDGAKERVRFNLEEGVVVPDSVRVQRLVHKPALTAELVAITLECGLKTRTRQMFL